MPPQRHLPKSSEPKARQRSSRACGPCRKRKIKCDATFPCAACTGYGYDCVYTEAESQNNALVLKKIPPAPKGSNITKDAVSAPAPIAAGQDKADDHQYVVSESFVVPLGSHPLLHQSIKTRFTSAHSAIAFPRSLGMTLKVPSPPRLQSFGWNSGIRPEPAAPLMRSIRDIISLDQLKLYSSIFFNEINPFFGIFNHELYLVRLSEFCSSKGEGTDFEACVCGIVALGSLFAGGSSCPVEAEVVEQGRLLLDHSTAYAPALLSMKHVAAWTLRAIYLRSTTRPHLSWIASCTAVHIAESIGLHREFRTDQIKCDVPRQAPPSEINFRRRTFWITIALNQFLSCEYGRTSISIDSISCELPVSPAGDFTAKVIEIMRFVPKKQLFNSSCQVMLLENLKTAADIDVNSPFIGLLKADSCFCMYRKLMSIGVNLPASHVASLLEVIRVALDSVKFLTTLEHPWWNIVSTPFQTVCVLLSLATPESLTMIPHALETLKNVTTTFDSHLSREALSTAATLVKGARDKRSRELDSLDQGLGILGEWSSPSRDAFSMSNSGIEWLMDSDMGFENMFDQTAFYPTTTTTQ